MTCGMQKGFSRMFGSAKYVPSVCFCLVVLGGSLPAAAQDAVPLIEVGGGYNYLRETIPPRTDASTFNGLYADLAIYTPALNRMLAIVGQVSFNPKDIDGAKANQRMFMGGVRVNGRAIERTVLFAHFLAGGTNSQFGNGADGFDEWTVFYTWQIGGGVNVMVTENVGLSLGADYLQVHGKHDSTLLNHGFNMVRLAAGIVLPFGTR
jgi:hypothetical protein